MKKMKMEAILSQKIEFAFGLSYLLIPSPLY